MKPADLSKIDLLRWAVDQPPGERIIAAVRGEKYASMQARLRAAVVHSHAVVFDRAASLKTGQISNMGPEVLLHLAQSARLPWDSVIVQIDRPAFWDTANEHWTRNGNPVGPSMSMGEGDNPEPPEPPSSDQLLFLMSQIDGNPARIQCLVFVAPVTGTEHEGRIDFLLEPLVFAIDVSGETVPSRKNALADSFRAACERHLLEQAQRIHTLAHKNRDSDAERWTPEEFYRHLVQGRDPLDLLILGREFVPDRSKLIEADGRVTIAVGDWSFEEMDSRVRLAAMAAPISSPFANVASLDNVDQEKILELMTEEILGVPRMAICILTALGISGGMVLTDVRPRGHRMVGNRRCPYLATSRIVIDLAHPMHRVRPRLEGDSGQHKRAHEVRGFWRYYQKLGRGGRPGCAHHWDAAVPAKPEQPIDRNKQACVHCGARRTWIPQHQRGDASLGFVHHDAVEVTDTGGKRHRKRDLPLTSQSATAIYETSTQGEKHE